ncbi:TonB-linked outer membrane protein, SusC/RagA family [uncultured Dysgonomonas sp.]|uniref:TonB-linked outer membrane protein, SusC/RagA family n=2 Tax=uncultured Dysgonomonas sp. TaxID=206096 RepID=A0A212IUF4_9BACT|nr:TonB-linked outer membrane protein, SusC/RagA family [uncultured Dysgonomonas sp.]
MKLMKKKCRYNILFVILLCLFSLPTQAVYGQQAKLINIDKANIEIKEAFKLIERQTDYRFFYTDILNDLNKKITIKYSGEKIEPLLNKVLENTDLTYKLNNDTKVITIAPLKTSRADSQKRTPVSGKIVDEKEEAIIGASVKVKGTNIGTITDTDGSFSLDVPDGATLTVTYIGFNPQDIKVEGRTNFRITLSEDAKLLDEVVVVGYGTMKKSDLTGSITSLKAEDIIESRSLSFVNAMQGKMAGVQISSASGELGASSRISIRGANSVYGSSLPLYVIDGVQMDVNTDEVASAKMGNGSTLDPLSSINPSDIESIEVLKDASATAIYGSRGANGVIIVTTRSGKVGKTRINYDGNVSFGTVTKKIDVLGASDFIDYRREIDENTPLFYEDSNNDGAFNELDKPRDPYSNPSHDWQSEMLRTAISTNHNISADGGSDKLRYSTSLGYTNNEGIIINNNYNRITSRTKLDIQATKRLKFGSNISISHSKFKGVSQSGGEGNAYNGVVQSLVTARPVEVYIPSWDNTGTYVSPIAMLKEAYKSTSLLRGDANVYGDYLIMEGLSLNISAGGFYSSSKGNEFYGKNTEWGAGDIGRAIISENRAYYLSNTNQISYKKDFGWSNLDAMAAFEINHYNYESFGVDNSNFLDESTGVYSIAKGSVLKSLYSYRGINNRLSYLARVYYDLYKRYLITVSIRADGSDKFGKNNKYGYFPSAAVAWRLSEEKFLKDKNIFDNLKLRLSYGRTGNERIPPYQYMANMENSYYNGILGLSPSTAANEDLKWESTAQYNAGVDVAFLKNRIQLTFDAYKKVTDNMLMPTPIPSQSGFSTQWQNIGRVDNSGIEVQLTTHNIATKDFEWTTNFNISRNKNKVKSLGGVDFIPVSIGGGWITNVGRVIVGEEIGTAYGYVFDGIYQLDDFTWQNNSDPNIEYEDREFRLKDGVVRVAGKNVKPGSFKFKNLNGSEDNLVDENDQSVISRSSPKFFGGITNSFRYKNFELSVFLSGAYGNEVFNESRFRLEGGTPLTWLNLSKDFWDNRWTTENPTNKYGTFSVDTKNVTSMMTSSYYVEDASYLRLKTLSIAYNVPHSFLKSMKWSENISNLKVYVTGDNLYTWTKYTGFDPEIDSNNALLTGFDRISYPRTRTLVFGVNVTF